MSRVKILECVKTLKIKNSEGHTSGWYIGITEAVNTVI